MEAAVLVEKASLMVEKIDKKLDLLGLDKSVEERRFARAYGVSKATLDALRYKSRHPKMVAGHTYLGLLDIFEDLTWKIIDAARNEIAAVRAGRPGADPRLISAACALLREAEEVMGDEVARGKALRAELQIAAE